MNVKETFVDILTKEGYDVVTACEIATESIKEILSRPPGKYILLSKFHSITVHRKRHREKLLKEVNFTS